MARRKIYCLFSGIYKYTCTSEVLKEKFEPVLKEPGVVGLSIGTRPDCLPDDVVEYLADLNQRTYLWVELGLQTIHQSTSDLINRAHDMQRIMMVWQNYVSIISMYVHTSLMAYLAKTMT